MVILKRAINSINAAALLIGAAGLLSRLLGVLRDRLLAGIFGASRELDIYYAAFQIPDFLFTLFLLGASAVAILPVFTQVKEADPGKARKLIEELAGIFLLGALVLGLMAVILAPFIIPWLAPGFSVKEQELTVILGRIMMLSPILLGLSGIVSAVIQSYRRFFVFALSAIFYNLGIIAGILFFLPFWGLPGLALGVVLGASMHILVQLPTFFELGFGLNLFNSIKVFKTGLTRGVIKVLSLSIPRVIALSVNNLTNMVLIAIASTLAVGSISVFQFASNLSYIPIGLFGISFSVAAFPALSEHFIHKDAESFLITFYDTLRSVLFWVLPLVSLFYVLRAQIVRVALGAGRFDWQDTRLTAAALGISVLAIMTQSLLPLLIKSFYALDNTKKPLLLNLCFAFFTVAAAFLFLQILAGQNFFSAFLKNLLRIGDLNEVRILGIVLAVALGGVANVFFLGRALLAEIRLRLGENKTALGMKEVGKMVLASLAAGFIAYGSLRLINLVVTLDTFWGVFIQGATAGLVGFAIYGLLLYFFKNREINRLLEIFKNHFFTIRILPRQLDGNNIK